MGEKVKPQDRTRAILQSGLKTNHKVLLIAIADRLSSGAGTCWPGNQLLADACSMSVRRMQDNKRALIAAGVLTRVINGRRADYSIRWDALSMDVTSQVGRSVHPTMDETSTLTMDETSNRSDQGSDQEATNPPKAPQGATDADAPVSETEATNVTSDGNGMGDPGTPGRGEHQDPTAEVEREVQQVDSRQKAERSARQGGGAEEATERDVDHREGSHSDGTNANPDPSAEAWTALCKATDRNWKLDDDWKRWLKQGAKRLGGWNAWRLIARWVEHGGPNDGDAEYLRKRRDPVTLIRRSNCARYHAQAQSWENDQGFNGTPQPRKAKPASEGLDLGAIMRETGT